MLARKLRLIKMLVFIVAIKAAMFTDGIILASFWHSALPGLVFSSRSLRKCLYLRQKKLYCTTPGTEISPLLPKSLAVCHQHTEYTLGLLVIFQQLWVIFHCSHSFYLQMHQLQYPIFFIHLQAFGISWGAGKNNFTCYCMRHGDNFKIHTNALNYRHFALNNFFVVVVVSFLCLNGSIPAIYSLFTKKIKAFLSSLKLN